MNADPITGLFGAAGILVALFCIMLAVMAILMPIFVFIICNHCERMRKTLSAMEHMMRHGK